jgi:hypothetical protein
MMPLNLPIEHFLPFSLLHTSEDQYCFTTGQLSGSPAQTMPVVPLGSHHLGNPYAMAGHNDQAILDRQLPARSVHIICAIRRC